MKAGYHEVDTMTTAVGRALKVPHIRAEIRALLPREVFAFSMGRSRTT